MLPVVQDGLQILMRATGNPWISHKTAVLCTQSFHHTLHQNQEKPAELSFAGSEKQRPQDDIDFVLLLKTCALQKDLCKGSQLHGNIVKNDLLKHNIFIGNTLVSMYAKCSALAKARQMFDELPFRTLVSWTALIIGFAEQGRGEDALKCYEQMICNGHSPDAVTLAGILKACGSIGAAEKGKIIHAEILREGLLEKFIKLGSALVDMYAKCGALAKAREVFDELPVQNIVSWTTLIGAYSQQECGEEALNCFEQMKDKGLFPDAMTFSCILKTCGSLGAAMKGQEIHAEIARRCLLDNDTVLASALVDMYAKCGALAKAQGVFDELLVQDVGSWTALITGYDQMGKHDTVLDLFNKMIGKRIDPNSVTFIIVLNACRCLSLVVKGQQYFKTMKENYGIVPTLEHHTCMVGLFGSAGYFEQAMKEIKKMPSSGFLPAWHTLLAACRKWGNVNHGRVAFEHAVGLDKKSAVAYVCMSDIYAAAGMQDDADKIEALRVENEAWILEEDRGLFFD
ncbi:hypothetical protein GOP47_0023203 [Adiantum capillus-veneris]|uniref:Pentatricopeptide repeat-containing protein n=1 Tax=Adiantum capillus-veneris TaxID=13818 RepID=A0A9D4Z620_ADICA|nr:hypothetical protein GOP47_0023203 [Adiantum capillus-veneris]